jgi:hypothetical protein
MKTVELNVGQSARCYFAVREGEEARSFSNPTDYWLEVEQGDEDEVETWPQSVGPDVERDEQGRPKEGTMRSSGWCPVSLKGKRPGVADVRVTFRESDGAVHEEALRVLVHSDTVLTAVRVS